MPLSLPVRLAASGSLLTHPDGTPAEVGQSVAVLLATRVGERRCEPGYGSTDPLGAPVDDVVLDTAALTRFEPRATPTLVGVVVEALYGSVQG